MRLIRDRKLVGALVVLNPKEGTSGLRGIVRAIDRNWVTLQSVEVQNGNVTVEAACQRVLVPRSNVAWIGVEADGQL
jgi:hypothetical protein